MFGISYVTFVFCIMYHAPNRLLPGCACYWFTPICYYQLISCINWPLIPAQNRGSPIPAASSETTQKKRNPRSPKIARPMSLKNRPIGRENRGTGNTASRSRLVTKRWSTRHKQTSKPYCRSSIITLIRIRDRRHYSKNAWEIEQKTKWITKHTQCSAHCMLYYVRASVVRDVKEKWG